MLFFDFHGKLLYFFRDLTNTVGTLLIRQHVVYADVHVDGTLMESETLRETEQEDENRGQCEERYVSM